MSYGALEGLLNCSEKVKKHCHEDDTKFGGAFFFMFRNVIPYLAVPATAAGIQPPAPKFPIVGDAVMQEFHLCSTEVVQVLRVMFFHSEGAVFVHSATVHPVQ